MHVGSGKYCAAGQRLDTVLHSKGRLHPLIASVEALPSHGPKQGVWDKVCQKDTLTEGMLPVSMSCISVDYLCLTMHQGSAFMLHLQSLQYHFAGLQQTS